MEFDYVSAVTVREPSVKTIPRSVCVLEKNHMSGECGKTSPKLFINTTKEFTLKSSVDAGKQWGVRRGHNSCLCEVREIYSQLKN